MTVLRNRWNMQRQTLLAGLIVQWSAVKNRASNGGELKQRREGETWTITRNRSSLWKGEKRREYEWTKVKNRRPSLSLHRRQYFFFFFYRHETITIDQNREFFRINTTDKTILFANRSGIRHFPSNERANIRKNIRSDNDRITFFNMYD